MSSPQEFVKDMMRADIVRKFYQNPHQINFIMSYAMQLGAYKEVEADEVHQESKNKVIAAGFEFKRWFWSFLENAVVLHTKVIEVQEDLLANFDVNLIVKYLRGEGVAVVILSVD